MCLLGFFLVSRLAFRAMGVRYDPVMPTHSMQLLDPDLLQHRLLESVWYLHVQPPLFNVFVGLVLNLAPGHVGILHLSFAAAGAALVLLLYWTARCLGLGRWLAVATALVISCGSTVVLYENWFQYEYPIMVGLTAVVAAFAAWQRTGRLWALALTLGLAASVVLTRLYHPVPSPRSGPVPVPSHGR